MGSMEPPFGFSFDKKLWKPGIQHNHDNRGQMGGQWGGSGGICLMFIQN